MVEHERTEVRKATFVNSAAVNACRSHQEMIRIDARYAVLRRHFSNLYSIEPRSQIFSVMFQVGVVQSSVLRPPDHAERRAGGRSSASAPAAGRSGLFAQTLVRGVTAAPRLQQVPQLTHVCTFTRNFNDIAPRLRR